MASRLCLLSDELVDRIAAFDITDSLNLHDPRFGNAGNSEFMCPTCTMRNDVCMGHHASLSLGLHMFHPIIYKESQRLINSTCLRCGTPLVRTSKSRAKRCAGCGQVNHGDYVIYGNDMEVAVRQNGESMVYAGDIPKGVLPDGHVVSKILIPPIHLRTPEDMEWPTDIQRLYEQLVATLRSGGNKQAADAYLKLLGVQGLMGVISGKSGVFRQLMMGKRVERSARAVIVGDPCLRLDQVAIPRSIAGSVRVRTTCTVYNGDELRRLASEGSLWWPDTGDLVNPRNILGGMAFDRGLKDGDLTLLNRQPSLSRVSLMCFRVVIRRDWHNVFAINPQVTPPFNADFDGDEMNTFFMFDSAEMAGLCNVLECRTTPVQDVVTGCYMMSLEDVPVSDGVWDDCMMLANTEGQHCPKTTFNLLSACIPGYDNRTLRKGSFSKFENVDMHALQLVVERWLSVQGLTVSLRSVSIPEGVTLREEEDKDTFKERCIDAVSREMKGTGIMSMIDSGAKGSVVHASHMAASIGQQYIGGKEGIFCRNPYSRGLTPDEFFGHQMAAREGVVSTGVGTASTGYLNRRACKIIADLKFQYNGTVADENFVSSFHA